MGNSANKRLRAEEQDDPFNRLPDDIIIQILDKVCDAKSLCSISLVSKKFSSLVYQTHVVSFKIDYGNPPQDDRQESWPWKILHFVTGPLRFIHGMFFGRPEMQQTSPPASSTSKGFDLLPHVGFLGKLTSMRSLQVEINYAGDHEVMVKWKADCSSPASCVLLIATGLDEPSPSDDDVYDFRDNVDIDGFRRRIYDRFLKESSFWFSVLQDIVPRLPESLQNVVVTDSNNHGKFVLRGDELVGVRNKNAIFLLRDTSLRFWHAPVVKLPSLGYAMKMVAFLICKDTETGKDIDDYSIVAEAFQAEEERVYFEAATELINKEVKFFLELPIERKF